MKKEIIIRFNLPGLHYWPDCDLDEVSYLKHQHRHMFHFEVTVPVNHANRDIEFIKLKNEIVEWMTSFYGSSEYRSLNFGSKSCESIGEDLLKKYPFITAVAVFEDNENGAKVYRE